MKKNYLLFSLFLIASFGAFGQAPCSVNLSNSLPPGCGDSLLLYASGTLNSGACNNGNVFNEDFNSSLSSNWDFTTGLSSPIITSSNFVCGHPNFDNSIFLWMGNDTTSLNAPRGMATNGFDLTGLNNVNICFEMRYAIQGGTSLCEGPDMPNEGVSLQYSIDNGTTWVTLDYWAPTNNGQPGGFMMITGLDMTFWNQFNG